jgi:hypothetical protein
MSVVGGGDGDSGLLTAGSPEYWSDRAEARISDAGVELTREAREILRELIHGGSQRDKSVEPSDLEGSLDEVVDLFVSEVTTSADTLEVHGSMFESVWARICFYPWCRR